MLKTIQKGFTLIELAIVIAILGILAAVALNNMGNTQAAAECSMIKDMAAQLASGYATYTAAEGTTPAGFNNYVTTATTMGAPTGTGTTRRNYSISLAKFGPNAKNGGGGVCTVAAAAVTCTGSFNNYTTGVAYQFNNGAILLNRGNSITATTTGANACQQ